LKAGARASKSRVVASRFFLLPHRVVSEVLMSLVPRILPRGRLLLALVACGALAACGSDSRSPFQPEISNPADNFQLQATNVSNVTTTKTYSWANSGRRASGRFS
jgi:hypothetical protein